MWRDILQGRDLLPKGLGRVIGNGESVSVFSDRCAGNLECFLTPPVTSVLSNEMMEKLKVSQLTNPITRNRDMDKINNLVAPYQWVSVLTLPISCLGTLDKFSWKPPIMVTCQSNQLMRWTRG